MLSARPLALCALIAMVLATMLGGGHVAPRAHAAPDDVADEEAARLPQGRRADAALTSFEAGPLRSANLIVAGWSLGSVSLGGQAAGRQEIATVKVQRVLHGTVGAKEIRVYVDGPKPTRSLRAPSRTGFPPVDSGRHVFFLEQRAGSVVGARYRDSFKADGAVGQEKIEALEKEVTLAHTVDSEQRARATLAHLLACLSAKGRWTRAHGSRELLRFAKARRDLMVRSVQDTIRSHLTRRQSAVTRAQLTDVLRHLRETTPSRGVRPREPGAPAQRAPGTKPKWQEIFEKADPVTRASTLERALVQGPEAEFLDRAWWYFEHGESADQVEIVRLLSRERFPSILPRLRRAYATVTGRTSVRREIVLAIGRMGDDRVLPWLQERLSHKVVRRQALLAIANIGTPEALRRLRAIAADLGTEDTPEAAGERKWIEHLVRTQAAKEDG